MKILSLILIVKNQSHVIAEILYITANVLDLNLCIHFQIFI